MNTCKRLSHKAFNTYIERMKCVNGAFAPSTKTRLSTIPTFNKLAPDPHDQDGRDGKDGEDGRDGNKCDKSFKQGSARMLCYHVS
jgi:hypothetical protein